MRMYRAALMAGLLVMLPCALSACADDEIKRPERWARVVRMKNLTVSVTGQNLFYWTGSSLYNPEYGVNGNGGYAIPRTVLFGIKATF